jgi:hypothetical protein
VVIGLGGMLVALATLITAEAADAAGYSQRHQAAPIAYNVQANPNYGFGLGTTERCGLGRPDRRSRSGPVHSRRVLRHYNNGW